MQPKIDLEEMLTVYNQSKGKMIDNSEIKAQVADMIKDIGRMIVNDPNLLYQVVMGNQMEREMRAMENAIKEKAEAKRDKKKAVKEKKEAIKMKEAAIKEKEETLQNGAFWRVKYEKLQQQYKDNQENNL